MCSGTSSILAHLRCLNLEAGSVPSKGSALAIISKLEKNNDLSCNIDKYFGKPIYRHSLDSSDGAGSNVGWRLNGIQYRFLSLSFSGYQNSPFYFHNLIASALAIVLRTLLSILVPGLFFIVIVVAGTYIGVV